MSDRLSSSCVAQIRTLIAELRAANQQHMTSHSGDAAYHAGAGMAYANAANKVAALLAVDDEDEPDITIGGAPWTDEEVADLRRLALRSDIKNARELLESNGYRVLAVDEPPVQVDVVLCTCGIVTGGARFPNPTCPIHAVEARRPAEPAQDIEGEPAPFMPGKNRRTLTLKSEPDGWQDIATAVKDQDAQIFGGWTTGGVNVIRWNRFLQRWCWPGSSPDQPQPTHWMPLPAPPASLTTPEEP